jgi:hypothetical protein
LATGSFKRRTASRQAVSRKVEGIEPRKRRIGKDDGVQGPEVKMDINATWQGDVRFPGVGDHGMSDNLNMRQPGRPRVSSWKGSMPEQPKREKGR